MRVPVMKLAPIIKPTGKLTVSLIIKFIFPFDVLFCMPITKIKNNEKLNVNAKNTFFNKIDIFNLNYLNLNTYYKLRFF